MTLTNGGFASPIEVALRGSQLDPLDGNVPAYLDSKDELREFRGEFCLPSLKGVGADPALHADLTADSIYLCGNSLGPLPKRSKAIVNEELDAWQEAAVDGHVKHPKGRPWQSYGDHLKGSMASLLGVSPSEVALMASLTTNLHNLMISFYRPTGIRRKILYESGCFPSDQYAFESQVHLHGLTEEDALLPIKPREGELLLRTEDILEVIERDGGQIALILFSGIQYYSGQLFDIETITRAGRQAGAIVGWDLAHAVGNVPLKMHDWDADFAAYCTYKYMNSSPGGLAGIYVHSRHTEAGSKRLPKLAGWFGHDRKTRFDMRPGFKPEPGADGWIQSCTSALPSAALLGSLQVFDLAGGMEPLRRKSKVLTSYFETLLKSSSFYVATSSDSPKDRSSFTIITPQDPEQRGAQLSILFFPTDSGAMVQVFEGLKRRGVTGDKRKPDVIRLAPAPLFNTFADVRGAFDALEAALSDVKL